MNTVFRKIGVLALLLVLLSSSVLASCRPPSELENAVHQRCAASNMSQIVPPNFGTVRYNGDPVSTVDCSQVDDYTYHVECPSSRTYHPNVDHIAPFLVLFLIPSVLTGYGVRKYRDAQFVKTLGVAGAVPAVGVATASNVDLRFFSATILVLLGSVCIPFLYYYRSRKAVERPEERQILLIITVSAVIISILLGLATMPAVAMY